MSDGERDNGHVHHAVNAMKPRRHGATVDRNQFAIEAPRPEEDPAGKEFRETGLHVHNGEADNPGFEPPLDDEGLPGAKPLVDPRRPITLTDVVPHEYAVGTRREIVRPTHFEDNSVPGSLRQFPEISDTADLKIVNCERKGVIAGAPYDVGVRQYAIEQLELIRAKHSPVERLMAPEHGKPCLVAVVCEFRNEPHAALVSGKNNVGERPRCFKDRELPPNRSNPFAAEEKSVRPKLYLAEAIGGQDFDWVAKPSHVFHKPRGLRNVALGPLMRNKEHEQPIPAKPVECPFPFPLIDAVRRINMDKFRHAAGHFIVLRQERRFIVAGVMQVGPPNAEALSAGEKIRSRELRVRWQFHSGEQDCLNAFILANQLVAGLFKSPERPQDRAEHTSVAPDRLRHDAVPTDIRVQGQLCGECSVGNGLPKIGAAVQSGDRLLDVLRHHNGSRRLFERPLGTIQHLAVPPRELPACDLMVEVLTKIRTELIRAVLRASGRVPTTFPFTDDHDPLRPMRPRGHRNFVAPTSAGWVEAFSAYVPVKKHHRGIRRCRSRSEEFHDFTLGGKNDAALPAGIGGFLQLGNDSFAVGIRRGRIPKREDNGWGHKGPLKFWQSKHDSPFLLSPPLSDWYCKELPSSFSSGTGLNPRRDLNQFPKRRAPGIPGALGNNVIDRLQQIDYSLRPPAPKVR